MNLHRGTKKGKSSSKSGSVRHSMKAHSFDAYLKDALKNPKFRKGYEEEKRKLDIGYQVFLARTKLGMTQTDLAHKIGTRQSNISRLEFGNYNFTVEMLSKIARALGAQLKIELLSPASKKPPEAAPDRVSYELN